MAGLQRSSETFRRSGSSGMPALDPPSPRVAACGFCNLFGKDKHQARPRGGASAKSRRR
uniref:Uncharacterized protein n=1 Tax=Oryza punctata TaxID=4537 RepID=A0A0E0JMZ7_ORYPU